MTTIELLNFVEKIGYFKDIHIVDNTVVCFYQTMVVKYKNKKNEDSSYLFPTTFRYLNNKIYTTMIFGSVLRDFIIPKNVNGVGYGTELKLYGVNNHLYNLLVGENISDPNTDYFLEDMLKSYVCIIEHLDSIGFSFMRITNNNSILTAPQY